MRDLKALIFDVFGTCVDWRGGVMREVEPYARKAGVALDAAAFAQAWRARYQPAMEQVRTGARPFEILDVLHRENLDAILPEFGLASLDEADRAGMNLAWHRLDPWPDVVAGLARLKTRYIVAPHSNGNIALIVDMAKRAGLPWDCVLGAEVVRAYKPAPRSYTDAVAMLGLKPAEVLMVAAHNGDLAAARAQGLKTGFVPRPLEHGPGQATDLAPQAGWDIVARDFVDLAGRLDA